MKKYIPILFYLILLSGCEKDSPLEPKIPDNDGEIDFVAGLPTLHTNSNTDLTRYSTKITGSIIDTGDSQIIEAGFVVDTDSSPTVQKNLNKFITEPDENGLMLKVITSIPANKTYYIRSYATNAQGTGYGNEIHFTSLFQKTFEGNVTLSSQQEVEDFGSEKYTTINGSLEITGSITDLSPLENLAIINYAFHLRSTSQLTTIKGLDSLEAVNASYFFHGIRIENNKALKSLEGLERLTANNGHFYIIDNDQLVDLNGLNNFSYNHFGEFRVEGCDQLSNLHGIEKFQWLDGDVMIKDNPVLENITAFGNLSFINGRIRIINNPTLQNLEGFKNLLKVDGIELYDNNQLSDLSGFCNLDTITSGILIRNNGSLKDFSGLEKIKTTEYLTIDNSPALTSLKGLENLEEVKYKVEINNSGLTNMSGLENLKQTERFYLRSNEKLKNLVGLNKLSVLANNAYSLNINSNSQLQSLEGLDNLLRADGQIYIGSNQVLVNFCSLKPLLETSTYGSFIVEGNASNPNSTDIRNSCP